MDCLGSKSHPQFGFKTLFVLACSAGIAGTTLCSYCQHLFDNYPVSPQWVVGLGEKKLAELLKPLSRQNKMAEFLVPIAKDLLANHGGKVPASLDQLAKYKGIKSKIGNLIITTIYGIRSGIAVDRHLYRVFKLLQWVPRNISGESEAMMCVQQWLPMHYWNEVSNTIAGL